MHILLYKTMQFIQFDSVFHKFLIKIYKKHKYKSKIL